MIIKITSKTKTKLKIDLNDLSDILRMDRYIFDITHFVPKQTCNINFNFKY